MSTQPRSMRGLAFVPAVAMFATLVAFSGPADAQRKDRPGKDVVEGACTECHGSGKDGAPRIGDAKAWLARTSHGLTGLTSNALAGIRKMPAHGGSPGLSDLEIQRAITYMVNRSGGQWVEPIDTRMALSERTPEGVVQAQCASCHQDGKDGAPKIGDRTAWTARLARGLDPLVASAVHGHGPMPARGGMPDLSGDDLRHAILYMFNFGLPPPPAPAPTARADPYHKIVSGTDIYFGLMRAEAVRECCAPSGKGYYHLNVALADAKSHSPVKDAQVKMSVSDGMASQTKRLKPVVANNAVTYGNYFRFTSGSAYNIVAEIQRPGQSGTLEARFEFRAP